VTRHEDLEFPPLHVSLERQLGDYYQDFSGAIVMLEKTEFATLDSSGLPRLTSSDGRRGPDAVTVAQYALANMTALRRGDAVREERARRLLDWLVNAQEPDGPWAGCWLMHHDNRKYRWLRGPWTGTLASGNAISALLRGWELFGVEQYRNAAEGAYAAVHRERRGLQLLTEDEAALWYEEYPADPPIHVLNGHVYTLFGIVDIARVSGDPQANERWRKAAATVLSSLDRFDLGYWSLYDLGHREPTSRHYHKNIHIPQLRILAALTGEHSFDAVADRWEAYLNSTVCQVRWWLELRVRRWRDRQS
jgi:heparosan-N-sulfate-glucuronate 5-epimerase